MSSSSLRRNTTGSRWELRGMGGIGAWHSMFVCGYRRILNIKIVCFVHFLCPSWEEHPPSALCVRYRRTADQCASATHVSLLLATQQAHTHHISL